MFFDKIILIIIVDKTKFRFYDENVHVFNMHAHSYLSYIPTQLNMYTYLYFL